jgi:hypothetical protein
MKIVDPDGIEEINFAEYISAVYRNKNKPKLDQEREYYRKLYQDKIQREQHQEQNEKWGKRNATNTNSNSIKIDVPMKYIVSDGTKHWHKTGMPQSQCNNRKEKLTADTLMKEQERKGRPFYDP